MLKRTSLLILFLSLILISSTSLGLEAGKKEKKGKTLFPGIYPQLG